MDAQAFVSQASISKFHEGIFDWFSWVKEIELPSPALGPIFQCRRLKFRAVIDLDRAWSGAFTQDTIKRLANRLARYSKLHI